MTQEPRVTTSVALTLSENERKEALRSKGIKVIEIFRAGIEALEKKIKIT